MGNEALNSLSKQYSRGEISKPEYRQRRKEIINEATNFIEPVSSSQSSSTTAKSNLLLVGLVSAVIVITLLLVVFTK